MIEPFHAVVLNERIVRQAVDGTKAVWRLMSTPDGVGEWRPYIVAANGDILGSPTWLPLPGDDSDIDELHLSAAVTYH